MANTSTLRPRQYARFLVFTGVFAFLFSSILIFSLFKLDVPFSFSQGVINRMPSQLMGLLAETEGELVATVFMPRTDQTYHRATRYLYALGVASRDVAGASVIIQHVDPRRDVSQANRLIQLGAQPGTIVLQYGWRVVSIPYQDESRFHSACMIALMRLVRNISTRVFWLQGHGELDYNDFDGWDGGSEFARELQRRGFTIQPLDLTSTHRVPTDCDVLIIAGGSTEFAQEEIRWVEEYLARGGRLMLLASPTVRYDFLRGRGVGLGMNTVQTGLTLSGKEQVIRSFVSHPITKFLNGHSMVFLAPRPLLQTKVDTDDAVALDLRTTEVTEIIKSPTGDALGVAIEYGKADSDNLAYRPTRLVVLGDAGCAQNGLISNGGSNAELLVNAVSWLSGCLLSDDSKQSEVASPLLSRSQRMTCLLLGFCVPLLIFFLLRPILSGRRS